MQLLRSGKYNDLSYVCILTPDWLATVEDRRLSHVGRRQHDVSHVWRRPIWIQCLWCHIWNQGWGQFHFFNSIPIPIPLFSIPIPIPIPLLTISFNSNSNSRDFNSNSNSNSRDFKSRQSQFQKWPVDVFLEIDYNYINNIHVYKIIVINTISLISLV